LKFAIVSFVCVFFFYKVDVQCCIKVLYKNITIHITLSVLSDLLLCDCLPFLCLTCIAMLL